MKKNLSLFVAKKCVLFLLTVFVSYGTFTSSLFATQMPVDLSKWTIVQYEFNEQPDASWQLSVGNTLATQTVNADASILLGDFDLENGQVLGTWRVNTSNDDDLFGIVFGYQNKSQYYLFDWKQSDQDHTIGFAERGMSIKIVNVIGGSDPTRYDLWPTSGTENVSILRHNTIGWQNFVDYDFRLSFAPGQFEIEVSQGGNVLEHWTVLDNTYNSGLFGFYNYSQ